MRRLLGLQKVKPLINADLAFSQVTI
jgi:hypothetical protein